MPTYFFQVTNDGNVYNPEEGIDLPDLDAAWHEATIAFGQLVRDIDGALKIGSKWSIVVQDENRQTIRSIRLVARSH